MPAVVRPSPNEEIAVVKNAIEERRVARLKQVREQERSNAQKIKKKIVKLKERKIKEIASQLEDAFVCEQREQAALLQNELEHRLLHLGDGHNIGDKKHYGHVKPLSDASVENEEARYKAAIKKVKKEKSEMRQKIAEQELIRKTVAAMESSRRQWILSQPKPAVDPIDNVNPVKVVKPPVKKVGAVESFANTRYHMQTYMTRCALGPLVEKAGKDEQDDAKEAAVKHQEMLNDIAELKQKEIEERNEKAELRHLQAQKEEALKQAKDSLMVELEALELKDRTRRSQLVARIPKKVFQPPHQRILDEKARQTELECAFEREYKSHLAAGDNLLTLDVDRSALSQDSEDGGDAAFGLTQQPLPSKTPMVMPRDADHPDTKPVEDAPRECVKDQSQASNPHPAADAAPTETGQGAKLRHLFQRIKRQQMPRVFGDEEHANASEDDGVTKASLSSLQSLNIESACESARSERRPGESGSEIAMLPANEASKSLRESESLTLRHPAEERSLIRAAAKDGDINPKQYDPDLQQKVLQHRVRVLEIQRKRLHNEKLKHAVLESARKIDFFIPTQNLSTLDSSSGSYQSGEAGVSGDDAGVSGDDAGVSGDDALVEVSIVEGSASNYSSQSKQSVDKSDSEVESYSGRAKGQHSVLIQTAPAVDTAIQTSPSVTAEARHVPSTVGAVSSDKKQVSVEPVTGSKRSASSLDISLKKAELKSRYPALFQLRHGKLSAPRSSEAVSGPAEVQPGDAELKKVQAYQRKLLEQQRWLQERQHQVDVNLVTTASQPHAVPVPPAYTPTTSPVPLTAPPTRTPITSSIPLSDDTKQPKNLTNTPLVYQRDVLEKPQSEDSTDADGTSFADPISSQRFGDSSSRARAGRLVEGVDAAKCAPSIRDLGASGYSAGSLEGPQVMHGLDEVLRELNVLQLSVSDTIRQASRYCAPSEVANPSSTPYSLSDRPLVSRVEKSRQTNIPFSSLTLPSDFGAAISKKPPHPTQGSVELEGASVTGMALSRLRRKISELPEVSPIPEKEERTFQKRTLETSLSLEERSISSALSFQSSHEEPDSGNVADASMVFSPSLRADEGVVLQPVQLTGEKALESDTYLPTSSESGMLGSIGEQVEARHHYLKDAMSQLVRVPAKQQNAADFIPLTQSRTSLSGGSIRIGVSSFQPLRPYTSISTSDSLSELRPDVSGSASLSHRRRMCSPQSMEDMDRASDISKMSSSLFRDPVGLSDSDSAQLSSGSRYMRLLEKVRQLPMQHLEEQKSLVSSFGSASADETSDSTIQLSVHELSQASPALQCGDVLFPGGLSHGASLNVHSAVGSNQTEPVSLLAEHCYQAESDVVDDDQAHDRLLLAVDRPRLVPITPRSSPFSSHEITIHPPLAMHHLDCDPDHGDGSLAGLLVAPADRVSEQLQAVERSLLIPHAPAAAAAADASLHGNLETRPDPSKLSLLSLTQDSYYSLPSHLRGRNEWLPGPGMERKSEQGALVDQKYLNRSHDENFDLEKAASDEVGSYLHSEKIRDLERRGAFMHSTLRGLSASERMKHESHADRSALLPVTPSSAFLLDADCTSSDRTFSELAKLLRSSSSAVLSGACSVDPALNPSDLSDRHGTRRRMLPERTEVVGPPVDSAILGLSDPLSRGADNIKKKVQFSDETNTTDVIEGLLLNSRSAKSSDDSSSLFTFGRLQLPAKRESIPQTSEDEGQTDISRKVDADLSSISDLNLSSFPSDVVNWSTLLISAESGADSESRTHDHIRHAAESHNHVHHAAESHNHVHHAAETRNHVHHAAGTEISSEVECASQPVLSGPSLQEAFLNKRKDFIEKSKIRLIKVKEDRYRPPEKKSEVSKIAGKTVGSTWDDACVARPKDEMSGSRMKTGHSSELDKDSLRLKTVERKERTRRLYERNGEVQLKMAARNRERAAKENRDRARMFHEKLKADLRKRSAKR